MLMSRLSREKIDQFVAATRSAATEAQMKEILAIVENMSWRELGGGLKAMDERNKSSLPSLLTLMANIETAEDLPYFREQWPAETSLETNENILRLSAELKEVWGKPETEVERVARQWFKEYPTTDPNRWLVLPQLSYVSPAANLPGAMARAMFLFHEYCSTCQNPACKGTRYVAGRHSQKHCLLTPDCAKYGHRAAARRHYKKKAKADGRKSRNPDRSLKPGTSTGIPQSSSTMLNSGEIGSRS